MEEIKKLFSPELGETRSCDTSEVCLLAMVDIAKLQIQHGFSSMASGNSIRKKFRIYVF